RVPTAAILRLLRYTGLHSLQYHHGHRASLIVRDGNPGLVGAESCRCTCRHSVKPQRWTSVRRAEHLELLPAHLASRGIGGQRLEGRLLGSETPGKVPGRLRSSRRVTALLVREELPESALTVTIYQPGNSPDFHEVNSKSHDHFPALHRRAGPLASGSERANSPSTGIARSHARSACVNAFATASRQLRQAVNARSGAASRAPADAASSSSSALNSGAAYSSSSAPSARLSAGSFLKRSLAKASSARSTPARSSPADTASSFRLTSEASCNRSLAARKGAKKRS